MAPAVSPPLPRLLQRQLLLRARLLWATSTAMENPIWLWPTLPPTIFLSCLTVRPLFLHQRRNRQPTLGLACRATVHFHPKATLLRPPDFQSKLRLALTMLTRGLRPATLALSPSTALTFRLCCRVITRSPVQAGATITVCIYLRSP